MVPYSATRDFDLVGLSIFVKATERLSLSAAARDLGLPKSTVTRQIQKLEACLGYSLASREQRRFVLTERGAAFLPKAQHVLDSVAQAMQSGKRPDGSLEGMLRIAAPYSFGRQMLAPLLPPFMKKHPKLRVTLNLGSRPVDLLGDEADLAVRVGPPGSDELVARRLRHESIVLCASKAYLKAHSPLRVVHDLKAHRVLCIHPGPFAFTALLSDGTRRARVRLVPWLNSNEPDVLIQAACQHAGVAMLPESLIQTELERGRLVRVLSPWRLPSKEVNLLYAPSRADSAKVRAFADFVVAALRPTASVKLDAG